jgi:RNA polymerase sigma-70 factor, ECF subfamily
LPSKKERFVQLIVPHLDAAHNLARWLTRNDEDAQEAVQEAMLRAYKFFDAFHGTNGKAWLLEIVRNTCYTLRGPNPAIAAEEFDEELHANEAADFGNGAPVDPEQLAILAAQRGLITRALADLPAEFREVLVLREIEGMSYKEIAEIVAIPIGTVMSRLARGRAMLDRLLRERLGEERNS